MQFNMNIACMYECLINLLLIVLINFFLKCRKPLKKKKKRQHYLLVLHKLVNGAGTCEKAAAD